MALFFLLAPNLGVMTLCWEVGSISLNPLSLMSGFKKSFPTCLVISLTFFLLYSRQKAFLFCRKYFKSVKVSKTLSLAGVDFRFCEWKTSLLLVQISEYKRGRKKSECKQLLSLDSVLGQRQRSRCCRYCLWVSRAVICYLPTSWARTYTFYSGFWTNLLHEMLVTVNVRILIYWILGPILHFKVSC